MCTEFIGLTALCDFSDLSDEPTSFYIVVKAFFYDFELLPCFKVVFYVGIGGDIAEPIAFELFGATLNCPLESYPLLLLPSFEGPTYKGRFLSDLL